MQQPNVKRQSMVFAGSVFVWNCAERVHTAVFLASLPAVLEKTWELVSSPAGNTVLLLVLVASVALPSLLRRMRTAESVPPVERRIAVRRSRSTSSRSDRKTSRATSRPARRRSS